MRRRWNVSRKPFKQIIQVQLFACLHWQTLWNRSVPQHLGTLTLYCCRFVFPQELYDTIAEFNMNSKAQCSALSSTRSQKKRNWNKRQCPFNSLQLKIGEGSPEEIRVTMEERICGSDEFLSLGWKVEGVLDGENEGDDCDEVICAGWGEPGG